jgi:hypothetical protein
VNYNVSLFDWPSDNDWILYAPYTDKSFIRNVLTYDLGRQMGQYAPRTKLCEVILNGSYIGVYVLMERIKINPGRVNIDQLNYTDTLDNHVTGGYIIKVDKTTSGGIIAWTSPYTAQAPSTGPIYYQMHDPELGDLHPDQFNYIKTYVNNWETALKSVNFANPQIGFRAFSDEQSFIDFFILNELSKNVDGYRISTFLHKKRLSEGGKIHAGPLWDFNLGWGNANYCEGGQTFGWEINFNSVCQGNGANMNPFWLNRMIQDPVFANNLKCRWSDLRTSILSDEKLTNYIDSLGSILAVPADRNYDRWPILGVYVWPNNYVGNTFQEELTYMKNWVLARTAWMDANMFGTCANVSVESPITELKIIPNPTQDIVTITGVSSEVNLELKDFSGKIIRVIPIKHFQTTVDLSDLANGIYFITESISGIYAKIIKN